MHNSVDADLHIFKGTLRTETPAIMCSKWMIETFQPNNGVFEHDSEGPRRFLGQPLLSRITLRQSVARSAFKLP